MNVIQLAHHSPNANRQASPIHTLFALQYPSSGIWAMLQDSYCASHNTIRRQEGFAARRLTSLHCRRCYQQWDWFGPIRQQSPAIGWRSLLDQQHREAPATAWAWVPPHCVKSRGRRDRIFRLVASETTSDGHKTPPAYPSLPHEVAHRTALAIQQWQQD